MTLNDAFKEFTESEKFKQICKGTDSFSTRYRVYLGRFKKGELKAGAIVEILLSNGYEVHANKATKKNKVD